MTETMQFLFFEIDFFNNIDKSGSFSFIINCAPMQIFDYHEINAAHFNVLFQRGKYLVLGGFCSGKFFFAFTEINKVFEL